MRQRARTDQSHKAIVQALRKVGCKVLDLSRVGAGCPDLAVRIPRKAGEIHEGGFSYTRPMPAHVVFIEVKEPKGKLTPDQEDFIRDWPETVVVRSVAEALAAVGVH